MTDDTIMGHCADIWSKWVWHDLSHERNQLQTTQGVSRKCPDTIWPTLINGLLSNLKVKVDSMFRVDAATLAVLLWIQGTNIIMRTSHKPNFSPIGQKMAEIWQIQVSRVSLEWLEQVSWVFPLKDSRTVIWPSQSQKLYPTSNLNYGQLKIVISQPPFDQLDWNLVCGYSLWLNCYLVFIKNRLGLLEPL